MPSGPTLVKVYGADPAAARPATYARLGVGRLVRHSGTRSTIVTSQLPPGQWHDYVADPTLADAICDRLLHNAHRIVLQGPSRRKEGKLDS